MLSRVRLPLRFSLSDGSYSVAQSLQLALQLILCGLQVFLPLEKGDAEGVCLPCFSVSLKLLPLQAIPGAGGCGAAGPCGQSVGSPLWPPFPGCCTGLGWVLVGLLGLFLVFSY